MRLKYLGFLTFTIGTLISVSGCAVTSSMFQPFVKVQQSTQSIQSPQPLLSTPPRSIDPVALAIAQSAQQIQKAVVEMKEVNTAVNLPDITPQRKAQMDALATSVPPGLASRVTVSYDGVFTTLAEGIAKSVGWSYVEEGNRPPVIQVLHKEYNKVRAVDALRDIGYSLHGATLVLDSVQRQVIVRY